MNLDINALLDISDVPGVNGEEIVVYAPLELTEVHSNPNDRKPDLEEDYAVVRRNMHFQSQMLMDAAKIFLETAKNADSPRHMEVFSTLIGQLTNTSKELLKVHKDMKEITNEQTGTKESGQGSGNQLNINNAQVFIGSPTDLLDEIGDAFEEQQRIQDLNKSVVGE